MRRDGVKKSKRRKLFIPVLFILFLTGWWIFKNQSPAVVSPIPAGETPQTDVLSLVFPKKKSPDQLRQMVTKLVGSTWKNYSVYVRDLNSPFIMGINETVIYDAASVNKIPILAALYVGAKKGTIDLNRQITIQEKDIQDYGTGVIRYEKPGGTYSVKTLARLMMQQSDNTAAYILSSYIIPTPSIQELFGSWGMSQTEMVAKNETSNRDVSLLLPKLIDGSLLNPSLTQEVRAFLKDSEFEDRLHKGLPETATIYHKTGDAVATLHDVGVVEDGKLRYYIGIFTADITDEEETKDLMAKVSRLVYDYLK